MDGHEQIEIFKKYVWLSPSRQISQPPIGDHERHMQYLIRERMHGMPEPATIRSRGALLLELARELRELREELEERRYGTFEAAAFVHASSHTRFSF